MIVMGANEHNFVGKTRIRSRKNADDILAELVRNFKIRFLRPRNQPVGLESRLDILVTELIPIVLSNGIGIVAFLGFLPHSHRILQPNCRVGIVRCDGLGLAGLAS